MLEGTSGDLKFNPAAQNKGTHSRLLRVVSSLVFKIYKEGDSSNHTVQSVSVLSHPHNEKISLHTHRCDFSLSVLSLLIGLHLEESSSAFSIPRPHQVCKHIVQF